MVFIGSVPMTQEQRTELATKAAALMGEQSEHGRFLRGHWSHVVSSYLSRVPSDISPEDHMASILLAADMAAVARHDRS